MCEKSQSDKNNQELIDIYTKEIWNKAIEASILELEKIGHNTDQDIERIRMLKVK